MTGERKHIERCTVRDMVCIRVGAPTVPQLVSVRHTTAPYHSVFSIPQNHTTACPPYHSTISIPQRVHHTTRCPHHSTIPRHRHQHWQIPAADIPGLCCPGHILWFCGSLKSVLKRTVSSLWWRLLVRGWGQINVQASDKWKFLKLLISKRF